MLALKWYDSRNHGKVEMYWKQKQVSWYLSLKLETALLSPYNACKDLSLLWLLTEQSLSKTGMSKRGSHENKVFLKTYSSWKNIITKFQLNSSEEIISAESQYKKLIFRWAIGVAAFTSRVVMYKVLQFQNFLWK